MVPCGRRLNGIPVRHYPPHRKDLAIQYATDPAYRALLVKLKLWVQGNA
jgi:hypothetical protein